MVKFMCIMFLVILTGIRSCNSTEKCDESKVPEINFKFLLGGQIQVLEQVGSEDITSQFSSLTMIINKVYCDGFVNGPFEQNYAITTDGTLVRQSIGTWSFRMDNKLDNMNVNFFSNESDIGQYNIFYDELKDDDGGTAYFEFDIEAIWNSEKKDFYGADIRIKP